MDITATESTAQSEPAHDMGHATFRIVLISQDQLLQRALAELARESDCFLETALSAGNVLSRVVDPGLDLVLLDLGSASPPNLEASVGMISLIRCMELKTQGRVPIIALCPDDSSNLREECREAGMDGVLKTPLTAPDWRAVLARFLPDPDSGGHGSGFDLASSLSVTGGDLALLQELAGLFLKELPLLLRELRQAVVSRDAREIEMHAHKLKGAVANFGATEATRLAFRLESLGRQGQLAKVEEALDEAEIALESLGAELRHFAENA